MSVASGSKVRRNGAPPGPRVSCTFCQTTTNSRSRRVSRTTRPSEKALLPLLSGPRPTLLCVTRKRPSRGQINVGGIIPPVEPCPGAAHHLLHRRAADRADEPVVEHQRKHPRKMHRRSGLGRWPVIDTVDARGGPLLPTGVVAGEPDATRS